jgi:hypothetical protein
VEKSNSVIIVISNIAIAALYQPSHHSIQPVIGRGFYRRKDDAA